MSVIQMGLLFSLALNTVCCMFLFSDGRMTYSCKYVTQFGSPLSSNVLGF